MLCIDLTRADTESLSFAERPVLPPGTGGEDVVSAGEVAFAGHIEPAGRGYLIEGSVEGTARVRCVRCLGEFDLPFSERFGLHLLPMEAAPADDETRLGKGDLDVRFYDEPKLDLAEMAGEQFTLAMPMKPLCAEDCRGICPHCGANLNLGPCACPAESDDRWAPLLDWRPSE